MNLLLLPASSPMPPLFPSDFFALSDGERKRRPGGVHRVHRLRLGVHRGNEPPAEVLLRDADQGSRRRVGFYVGVSSNSCVSEKHH